MKTHILAGLAGLLLGFGPAHSLPIGVSGAWFNPEQSGHGISVQRVSLNRSLVFWYTGDPQGNPLTLYIEAETRGESLVGQAYDSRGIRFGTFDPIDHRLQPWGTVEIAFDGCHHATLRWQADGVAGGPAYGEGELALTRLANVAGVECRDAPVETSGLVSLGWARGERVLLLGRDGTLWDFGFGRDLYRVHALIGVQTPAEGWRHALDVAVTRLRQSQEWPNLGDWDQHMLSGELVGFGVEPGFRGELRDLSGEQRHALSVQPALDWKLSSATLSQIQGDYVQRCCGTITFDTQRIRLQDHGRFTGTARYVQLGRICTVEGQLRVREGEPGQFDATLTISDCGENDDGTYSGRAWRYGGSVDVERQRLSILVSRPATGTQRPVFAFEGSPEIRYPP